MVPEEEEHRAEGGSGDPAVLGLLLLLSYTEAAGSGLVGWLWRQSLATWGAEDEQCLGDGCRFYYEQLARSSSWGALMCVYLHCPSNICGCTLAYRRGVDFQSSFFPYWVVLVCQALGLERASVTTGR